jgi:hypothetical protein
MACEEILVHTHDAGTGLGASFSPDPQLAERLLPRLFPWLDPSAGPGSGRSAGPGAGPSGGPGSGRSAGPGPDPWATLLWANGRIDLPGRPHRASWRWRCAPLAEWNGRPPATAAPAL